MNVKKLTKPSKSIKKLQFHHLKHPFMVPVFTFFIFFFLCMILFIGESGQTVGANDSRIVELTRNGQTQVIPTTAPTVGILLNRLNIKLNPGDVVEPSQSTPILENNFQINIYSVHPVTVIENNQKTVIETSDNDPKTIAEDAGYKIYPQDYVNSINNADNLGQGVLGQEVQIIPAIPINLELYGTKVTQRTHAETVGQLLADDKIQTSSGNNVLPAVTTPITPNLQIIVVPVGQKLTSTQQIIPFATQNITSYTIPYGITQIQQAGANGLALIVEDTSVVNGKTVNSPLQTVVITQPVTEIIVRGTGITAIAGGNNITWLKSSDISEADYSYVNLIMNEESHWNPDDVNSRGCIGLGQFCNPQNLTVPCPDWQIDAVCQLNAFNSYAVRVYGTWAAAARHEENYGWW